MLKLTAVLAMLASTLFTVGATGVALAGSQGPLGDHAAGRGFDGATIVIDWNRELLDIVRTPGAQPATVHPTRSFALLHAAIYDAVVSITREGRPFLVSVDAPADARPDAAAAAAGHDILVSLYPAMAPDLDQQLTDELAVMPAGRATQQGIEVGENVAARLLAARAGDGSAAIPAPFTAGSQPGDYRPTPPGFAAPVFTNWGRVTPFVLRSGDQFRPAPPPPLTSDAYAQALNEVKSLGQDTSTTRTADQTVVGRFWAPPIWNTWNAIAEDAAVAHHANLERTAELFAALDLTFADSTIAFYDAKYEYRLWRPITAVRLADTDGNPATIGDPTWNSLTPTAPDPTYPGAHSTISAAGAAVLSAFFGDRDQIRVASPALPGVVRSFDSYSAVADEAGLSRIFAGQHTRIDHVAGEQLGGDVARFVLRASRIGPVRQAGLQVQP
ncbi:MAG: vanadium-dependent haloperoxidase [Betaproteobacteria bacterium]